MDIVSRALALPIPLPKEYVQSLPRIPKDKKFPKRVCRDVKVGEDASNTGKESTGLCGDDTSNTANEEATGKIIPLIILLVLCCLCCVSMISVSFGGYRWWKSRSSKYRSQTKTHRRRPHAKNV
jgi:hypothetical protein